MDGFEIEADRAPPRHRAICKIQKQSRDEGSLYHKSGISLTVSRVRPVVVNPVAVERKRRVAKQQNWRCDNGAAPLLIGARRSSHRFAGSGRGGVTEDNF